MKLFYSPGACSLADHLALAESGLPYTLVKVDLKTKQTEDGRAFDTINPKGYVPALELDGGAMLTENIAVLSYIAHKSGTLEPSAGPDHWKVLETTAFVSTEIHKNFKPFFMPDATPDEKEQASRMLAKRFATAADLLGTRDFVVGDALSIADCYLFVMLMWAQKNGIDLPATLVAYHGKLKARPAFAKALTEEGLG